MSTLLAEFDKVEWFDVCRKTRPELTWEEFEQMWADFQRDKAEHQRRMSLQ